MPTFALGPPGALVPFRAPDPSYTSPLVKLGATHELSGPHRVRDVTGFLRTITLRLPPDLTAEAYSALEALFVLPDGPYRFVDPTRRNLLTANQSTGTGALRTTEGWSAPAQGTITSDTAQARSGTRSLKWDTVTSLTLTGRGVYLPGPAGTPDSTWAAVLPGDHDAGRHRLAGRDRRDHLHRFRDRGVGVDHGLVHPAGLREQDLTVHGRLRSPGGAGLGRPLGDPAGMG